MALAFALVPTPAEAHSGHCARPETFTTFAIAALVAVLFVRPWRKSMTTSITKFRRLLLPLVLATATTIGACGGGTSTKTATRPATTARLQILQPSPNDATGPDITIKLNLLGARVVQATKGKLGPDQGHIHVSLDGKLVSMAYGTTQDLHGLKPGAHSVQAEFVAIDHVPFRNRVIAAVLFTVKP